MKYAGAFDEIVEGSILSNYYPLTEEGYMLIVEGPDGAGKSMLVERLSRDLKMPIAPKVVGSNTQPLQDLAEWTEANLNKGFQRVVFDRHRLISEPIYGPATRNTQDVNFLDLGWLAEMTYRFYQSNPLIVYCLPTLDVVRKNVSREDTDNSVVAGRITAIYAGYVARAAIDRANSSVHSKVYNYEVTRYEDVLGWVQRRFQERFIQDGNRSPFPQQSPASRSAAHKPRNARLF